MGVTVGTAVVPRTRPQRRDSVDGGGHGVDGLLVVDPPADESAHASASVLLAEDPGEVAVERRRSLGFPMSNRSAVNAIGAERR
jgi:hypothetical protein